MVLDTKRRIIREAKRAFLAWFAVYFMIFLCLLGYKWQTREHYRAEAAIKNLPDPIIVKKKVFKQVQVPKKNNSNSNKQQILLENLGKHEPAILDAIDDLETKVTALEGMLTLLEGEKELLDGVAAQLGSLNPSNISPMTPPANKDVGDKLASTVLPLLMTSSLSSLQPDELESRFSNAIQELQAHANNNSNNSSSNNGEDADWWNQLATILSSSEQFPEKEASLSGEAHCLDSTQVPAGVARMSDLKQAIHKINALLEKRDPEGDISDSMMPASMEELDDKLERDLEVLFREIVQLSKDSQISKNKKDKEKSGCIEKGQVIEMVEEGLMAINRRGDVRKAIKRQLKKLDPTISDQEIILDADLPLVKLPIPKRETINLQRVLDTPLLTKTGEWIDQLVELGGGYHDGLDRFLDSYASGEESVGTKLVRNLLEASGKVELTRPKALVEKLPPQAKGVVEKLQKLIG